MQHAQSTSVRDLIQKIENHPNRHALQEDLRQNQSFNPFSPESKQKIRDVGKSNYLNYSRRNPKRKCKVCLSYWTLASFIAHAGTSCVKEEVRIRNSSMRWTIFQFPSTSSRKDDLTDIDVVRSRETGNIIRPNQLKKRCKEEEALPGHP